ncbi:hypothetical protein D210916BOD24_12080 [Alteromonas sp. D210916BOD_24]
MISQTSNKPYFYKNDKLFKQAFTLDATNHVALRVKFKFLIDHPFDSLWSYHLLKTQAYVVCSTVVFIQRTILPNYPLFNQKL